MRNRIFAIFTTWIFVSSLAVLLINDHVLKQAYPGLVTGKLSDFAGIAVVALPLFAAFPRQARAIYLAMSAAFLWWKSPASSAFIAFMNDVQPLRIGRTVDYTDLLALTILPVCAKFVSAEPRSSVKSAALRRWVLPPVLAAAMFGVMATSKVLPRKDFAISSVESTVPFPRDAIVATIKEIALDRGLKPRDPLPQHWQGAFEGHGIFLTYTFREGNEIAVGMQVDSGTFGDGELRKAEALREEIKKTLTLRFKGLQFSEPSRGR